MREGEWERERERERKGFEVKRRGGGRGGGIEENKKDIAGE